jgi:hypothetical protein
MGAHTSSLKARAMPKLSHQNITPTGSLLLEFRCPQGSKPINVEVSVNPKLIRDNWTREIRVRCPTAEPYTSSAIGKAIGKP